MDKKVHEERKAGKSNKFTKFSFFSMKDHYFIYEMESIYQSVTPLLNFLETLFMNLLSPTPKILHGLKDLNTEPPNRPHDTLWRLLQDRTDDRLDNYGIFFDTYLQNLLENKNVQKNSVCIFFFFAFYHICHFQRIYPLGSHEEGRTLLSFGFVLFIFVHCLCGA